jgi:hypothetical protein
MQDLRSAPVPGVAASLALVAASLALLAAPVSCAATQVDEHGSAGSVPDRREVVPSVAELRARRPAGLDEELARYYVRNFCEIERGRTPEGLPADGEEDLDWHRTFEEAQQAARKLHRPILAVRMRYVEVRNAIPCAFQQFSAALYANENVSAFLRSHFVVFSFEESYVGRALTMVHANAGTGVHYVLDEDGHVLDALPGFYAPAVFRRELARSWEFAARVRGMTDPQREQETVAYLAAAFEATERTWKLLATRYAQGAPGDVATWSAIGRAAWGIAVNARLLDRRLTETLRDSAEFVERALDRAMDPRGRASCGAVLDSAVLECVFRAERAMRIAHLEQHILADTALNEFVLRQQIRHRIAEGETDLDRLDTWINENVLAIPRQ